MSHKASQIHTAPIISKINPLTHKFREIWVNLVVPFINRGFLFYLSFLEFILCCILDFHVVRRTYDMGNSIVINIQQKSSIVMSSRQLNNTIAIWIPKSYQISICIVNTRNIFCVIDDIIMRIDYLNMQTFSHFFWKLNGKL